MAENIQPGTIHDQEEVKVQSGRARAALPAADLPDKVHTWPYLVRAEFIAGCVLLLVLMVWSITVDAPMEEPANPTKTPNPSKAPWYFLGLQEMLVYFDPWMAGVVLPSMIIVGLMAIPYIDTNKAGNGYYTIQFAGVGTDYPVHKEIAAMYQAQGKQPPKEMQSTVYYNRGILIAALHVEAIRNALKATGGNKPTGTDVKKGLEQIRDFTLGGLVPPLEITPTDHEGGGWVQIFQVKGGKFVKETDWFRAYREVVEHALKTAE